MKARAEFARMLAIGGSDPSGGAGIQADLKTATMLGVYGEAAIAALTAQNSLGVQAVFPVSAACLRAQLEAVFEDAPPHAVKLGMMGTVEQFEVVMDFAQRFPEISWVCDPVLRSSSDFPLMDVDGKKSILNNLPRLTLLTPNAHEASALTGVEVRNKEEAQVAGRALMGMGARAVLLKGGHIPGDQVTDFLFTRANQDVLLFTFPRIDSRNDHGTGCVLASAIASYLAQGCTLLEAIQGGRHFLRQALQEATSIWNGHGHGGMHLHLKSSTDAPTCDEQAGTALILDGCNAHQDE
jgi:hydroxymethylpyrimidine/phosphomethylpyrimidine kinase